MQQEPQLMPFQDQPFNGDSHICKKFLELKEKYDIKTVIETGTCLGATTRWLGENFEFVITVEINEEYANFARQRIAGLSNIISIVDDSVNMLKNVKYLINPDRNKTQFIFFLDAHWGEHCPLNDEIRAIANIGMVKPPIIAIHDFKGVNDEFGYDTYNGEPFNYYFIEDALKGLEITYQVQYLPEYNTEAEGAKRGIVYLHPVYENTEII